MKVKVLGSAALAAALLSGAASAGTLTGNATISYIFGDGSSWSGSNTVPVVAGVDLNCPSGASSGACGKIPGSYSFDLGGNTIDFSHLTDSPNPYTASAIFNGYEFSNLNFGENITSVVLSNIVGLPGLTSSRITFTANSIRVNMQGLAWTGNNGFRLTLNPVASEVVPVPAALPLLLTGILGLGMASRRKKAEA